MSFDDKFGAFVDELRSSLALISARATITSIEVLTCLVASYMYILCQGKCLPVLYNSSS